MKRVVRRSGNQSSAPTGEFPTVIKETQPFKGKVVRRKDSREESSPSSEKPKPATLPQPFQSIHGDLKPPSIDNYKGKEALKEKGITQVALDEGALRWLWETAYTNLLLQERKYKDVLPHVYEAGVRAVTAIKATSPAPVVKQESATSKKRVVRKKNI